MIYYLVTREHAYTLNIFLETWGRTLRQRIRPLYYDQLAFHRQIPAGTYIFADLERLSPPQMQLVARMADSLRNAGRETSIVNDPAKVLRRRELLTKLHAAGKNPFTVHALDADPATIRFPVFIRRGNEHDGSLSDLLENAGALQKARDEILTRGLRTSDLLIVEFRNTADANGIFRKYSAFRVGPTILPRHLLIGRQWVLKSPDIVDAAAVAEERRYLETDPHQQPLREIFDIAGITYGRIDYSLLNNQLVTWEINTNPVIIPEPMNLAPERLPSSARFARAFDTALATVDTPAEGPPIPLHLPRPLRRDLGLTPKRRLLHSLARSLLHLKSHPAATTLRRAAGR